MTTPSPPRHRPRDSMRSALENRLRLAITSRRAFQYLALATAALTVLIGFLMTLVDKRDFPTLGDGLWWAVQTLSTVGYGDIVPHSTWGRLLGSLVIIMGVTFLAFLTASVTSMFIAAEQEQRSHEERREGSAEDDAMQAALTRIEERLAAIEARLTERGDT
jgi:voltage-gated potassium channel